MSELSNSIEPNTSTVLWNASIVPQTEHTRIGVGPLNLFFKKSLNEIWIATDRTQVEYPEPESLVWQRWAFADEAATLKVKPLLPDMQVSVRPEHAFRLVPNARINVYTRIPVWVGIYNGSDDKHKLIEVPSVELSKTWFGDFFSGSLSYGLRTRARREITPDMFQAHTIICTMNIQNASGGDLLIEKINILVERLSIFIKDGQLWSDEMDITFKGGDQHSEITMQGTAPGSAPDAVHVMAPRNPVKKSIAERILKEIHLF
ncbi:MAG: hypothetical protein JJU41_09165 [Bacteroidetes bacterium]|nr:hypothetical protein [Bacteroidota bacterium]MCH8524795.1 hypothetical protein [Balneolales bacterium]